ncbi:MAG: hypothetical protein ABI194_01595 [Gemmatimonadaceae bacterium]
MTYPSVCITTVARTVRLTARAARMICATLICVASWVLPRVVVAQDNTEIQVYGSETVAAGRTMLELHSNFTDHGRSTAQDGVEPTLHAMHETVEITHGFTPWFEVGFYTFTTIQPGGKFEYVGNHIRPRFRVPESWGLPVGLSLSQEIGYARSNFSADTWSWEIRPIIDQTLGRFYWSVNPALERSLQGPGTANGFEFAPAAKVSYDVTRRVTGGLEYYGAMGDVRRIDPAHAQSHELYPAIDLNLGPDWEVNFGVSVPLSKGVTDRRVIKLITGHRF